MTDGVGYIRRSIASNTEKEVELKIVYGVVPKWLNGIVCGKRDAKYTTIHTNKPMYLIYFPFSVFSEWTR